MTEIIFICTNKRTNILLFVFENVWLYYIKIEDYYRTTVYDMQNEKACFDNYNVFEHNHEFEIEFWKSDGGLLVFVISDNMYVYIWLIINLFF